MESTESENEESKPKTNGKRNKQAGHGWELEIIKRLKEAGFTGVGTTRNNSRARDAQKVDVMNIDEKKDGFLDFNIQAKNESRPTKYQKHLAEMPKDGATNVVIFKQTAKSLNGRFVKQGEYAIMYFEDWLEYIRKEKELKELKVWIKSLTKLPSDKELADEVSKFVKKMKL
jgi:hypothetical protein